MIILAPPSLMRNQNILGLASLARELGATRYIRVNGTEKTGYSLDAIGEKQVTPVEFATLDAYQADGLEVHGATLYIEMPISELNAYVPVSLPGSQYSIVEGDDEPELLTEYRRKWFDYVTCDIGTTHFLARCKPMQHSSDVPEGKPKFSNTITGDINFWTTSPKRCHGTKQEYLELFKAWAKENDYPVLYASERDEWVSKNIGEPKEFSI